MEQFYNEFNIDPNSTEDIIRQTIDIQRKKWSMRLNAPSLEKRQIAESKMKLLDFAQEFLDSGEKNETQAKKENPAKNNDVIYRKVQNFIDTKNYEQALSLIKTTKMAQAQNAELYKMQANIEHIMEQDETSFKNYKYAYKISPNCKKTQAMIVLTGSLCGASGVDGYLDGLDESLTSLVALGEYQLAKHDYAMAFEYAQRAYSIDNKDVDTLILMMKSMSGLGLEQEQFDKIYKIIRKLPEDDRLTKVQLITLYKQQNFKKCEQICKKIRMNNPNSKLSEYAEELLRKMNKAVRGTEKNNDKTKKSKEVKTANIEEALAQLDVLVGLDNVKEQLEKFRKKVEYDKQRKEILGLENLTDDASYHFVFSGNPGTGKTTVARLFSEVFYHLGILSKGHLIETDRTGLVGQFVGETAQKTSKMIKDAMGGVLFIDEAYSLMGASENDFGKEAIEVLVKGVEDNRDDLIVILAGYKNDMHELMGSNPGLASRFTKYIDFADYTEDELLEIAISIASAQKYTIDDDGKYAFVQKIQKQMLGAKFGNARAVRNIMNEAFEEKANVHDVETLTVEQLTTITAKDFGVDISEKPEEKAEKYLKELKELVGLESVKNDIESLIGLITFQKEEHERIGQAVSNISMHMVFSGNPGTGKTTVARLYGNLLREIGVLKQGQFIETSRADLVGKYLGQTAPMVKKMCENAFGGILFIDEAYALCTGDNDDFGQEAVNTLIKEMEDHRDKLVVILAGYSDNMDDFLSSNPGFGSRITKTLIFQDYNSDQLWEIFLQCAKADLIEIDASCEGQVRQTLARTYASAGKNFGNAREARKLFETCKMAMIMRVQRQKITGDERRKIILEDVPLV